MIKPWCVKCGETHFSTEPCAGLVISGDRDKDDEIVRLKAEIVGLKEKMKGFEARRKKVNDYQREFMRKKAKRG